ncbi:MAG: putative bifunctional diguanylate cyclase/phosphodiesterase, partial [Angustibacter sp.]
DLAYLSEGSSYREGRWVDLLWLLGTALIGIAAYGGRPPGRARTLAAVAESSGMAPVRVRWAVLALPALAMMSSVILLLALPPSARVGRMLAAACIVSGLARVALSFREVRDLTQVHRQARTDELTGLPNRRAMYELCEEILESPTPQCLTLLLIDLDRFKDINDALGHTVGDQLLIDVGQRIRRSTPADGAVCRLGGDEFAVLLPGRTEAQGAQAAAAIRQGLTTGVELSGITVHVQASIGVAVAEPSPSDDGPVTLTRTELLRRADVAMYEAKGRNLDFMGYSAVDSGQAVDRLITVSDLRRLVVDRDPRAGELVVHLQPQLQLTDRTVCGAEALVRWLHPDRGLVPPLVFLPAAEAAGLMGPLTERVLDLALAACAQWWSDGHRFPVAINVSAANVHDRDLPQKVAAAVQRHGVPARALTLEVTEDALMTDPAAARSRLDEIRALGAAASIDDYGSGYSSLGYLRDLSVDELKIDRSFINRLVARGPCTDIVRHTIEMAQALGLRTVAEGVDDELIVQVLTQLGCDIAQGFHIARPMPVPDFLTWVTHQPTVGHPFTRPMLMTEWR